MILEIASFDIKENLVPEFVIAMHQAKNIIKKAEGILNFEFHHCIETKTKFIALIQWKALENHTVGFRESELFVEWRNILSPYFNNPPVVEHYSEKISS